MLFRILKWLVLKRLEIISVVKYVECLYVFKDVFIKMWKRMFLVVLLVKVRMDKLCYGYIMEY